MQKVKRIAYRFEGFYLDPERRRLFGQHSKPIPLKPRAFDTLLCLVERSGQLIERRELLQAVWPKVVVHENNLDQAISALRRALGETRHDHRFIVTVPGRGYRFVARVEKLPAFEAHDSSVRAPAAQREADGSAAHAGREERRAAPRRYWARSAVTVALIVIGAVTLLPVLRDIGEPRSDPRTLHVTPLSLERGGQRSAVWSPDGEAVAFAARSTANDPFELYVRTMDSAVATPIMRIGSSAIVKQWTTTGEIVFVDRNGLWSVSPAGGSAQLIESIDAARYAVSEAGMDVSRDGSAVAVLGGGDDGLYRVWTAVLPDWTLARYEPAPFAARRIVNRPFLRFSPDGRQLLLIQNEGDGEQAWLLPFPPDASRPPRRILDRLRTVTGTPHFSWLPDNRHIVVSAATEARRELYLADTHSGDLRLLSRGQRDQVLPVVSPDGDKLIFTDALVDFDVVTLDLTTLAATPLIATRRAEQMPAWAADAERLVYVTDRSGSMEIWLHQPGVPDRPLVTAGDFSSATRWFSAPALSPDGTRVIYQRVDAPGQSPAHLWISAVDGGAPERVTNTEDLESAGSWSPDGAWFVYATLERNGGRALKKVRTTGQAEPETLLDRIELSSRFVPAWSPDGDWILIADRGMKLVSPDGETTRELGIENSGCAFAQTERMLYCIRARQQDGAHPLVAIDFDGNVVRVIGSVPVEHVPVSSLSPSLRLSLTPDGAGVTYAIGNVSEDLWLMEGLATLAQR